MRYSLKNIVVSVVAFIAFLIIYFLQINFFDWFNIAGVKPNLFVILVLFLGLYTGERNGLILGIIFGLFLDITMGRNIGISAIMLSVIGILGGYFDKNFSKDNRITIMLMAVGATFVFELGSYVLNAIILEYRVDIINFIKIVVIEMFFNMMLIIILYPLLKKIGYILENMYKSTQVITRYF